MTDHLFVPDRIAQVGSALVDPADARALQRAVGTGVERVRRGIYAELDAWTRLERIGRHRLRIDAVSATRRREPVFGYASAAVLWGIPVPLGDASPVHTIVPPESSARSKNGVAVHRDVLEPHELSEIGGILLTSPLRTLIDLARSLPFLAAVIALDFGLHARRPERFSALAPPELDHALARAGTVRGHARAARSIAFARPGADNPGESESRVVIHQLGFPAPELQVRHPNPHGGSYFTDTEWRNLRVIGEFDGRGKYLKQEYLKGMPPGEAVYQEKIREDHLRAEGNTVVRWGPQDLRRPARLVRMLSAAGLPRVARPARRPHPRLDRP